jgi:hypothetical protein
MDSDYGVSPFVLLRALGPILFVGPFFVSMIVTAPLLLYPLARWRAHRDPVPDPHLGIKFALGYLGMVAFQLALFGGAMFLYAILSKDSDKGSIYRFAFGLLVPSLIVLASHVALLKRTNQDQAPGVHRLIAGYNLVVTSVFGFGALIAAFEVLFAKGSSGDGGRVVAAAVVVYGGAWAAVGWRFARLVLGNFASGEPPSNIVTASATPPSGPQAQTLPSLGGGSFPPIEPK